jgi:hypothetical protein
MHWITYPPFVQPAPVLYTLFILRRMKINETLLWQIKTVLGASKAIKRKKIPQKYRRIITSACIMLSAKTFAGGRKDSVLHILYQNAPCLRLSTQYN